MFVIDNAMYCKMKYHVVVFCEKKSFFAYLIMENFNIEVAVNVADLIPSEKREPVKTRIQILIQVEITKVIGLSHHIY